MATTSPTTASYTLDPQGNMTSAGAPGMVDVTDGGLNSLGGLAPVSQDPYTIFQNNLQTILQKSQTQQQTNRQNLGGALNTLTTESVNPAGVSPFDPTVFSGNQVQNQQALQQGFQPAITSINTELQNSEANNTSIGNMITAEQNATQPLTLQPGQSLISRSGQIIQQGHSYTPQINPLTGLMDGFDQNTGTWSSEDSGAAGVKTNLPTSNNNLVGGIDFSGATTSTKPYATDPNYASEVDALYSQIKQSQPIPTASGLDNFIKNQVGGSAPVTGQMIMTAAMQYQVDPNILAAVLGHESDFGTAGAATKTMNAGNVGNTGTSTQAFNSWQQGVNAAALSLATRMPGNSNAQAAPAKTSNVGGIFSPANSAKVARLPSVMQNYVQAGPAGVAYIDDTRVPDASKSSLQTLAAQAGIPYLAAGDVSAMQSIMQAQQNLNLMQTAAKTTLGSGVMGYAEDTGATLINGFTGGNAFPNFNQFNSYATEAINLIRGLAGGNGSGLRMTQSEINTAQSNIPSSGDTIENAMKKVNVLQGLIYTRLSSVFPDAQVVMIDPKNGQQGYVPASQYSDAINEGYTTL